MAQRMKGEIRRTLSESDRGKLTELERGLKAEINKRIKNEAKGPEIDPTMIESEKK